MKADCHMHMILDGVEWRASIGRHSVQPDRDWIKKVLERYQARGYEYLRDGGDRWGAGAAAREMAKGMGIVYRTPLAPLSKRGHYGGFIGRQFENMKEYAGLVTQQREAGADFVKIMISGLMDFDRFGVLTQEGLPEAEIAEMIHIAHEEGMAVMAHANGARTMEAAARAKVDSVEHGAYSDEAALAAMKEAGTVWVPTLSTVGNLRGKGRFEESAVRAILECAMERVAEFAAMGGAVAPGSDAGAWAVPHPGESEFSLLAQALGNEAERVLEQGIRQIRQRF